MSLSSPAMDAVRPQADAARINWGPYLVGAGIGVLSWAVFVIVANPIGMTTSMSAIASGVASPIVGADVVAQNSYWKSTPMKLDYGTLFLVGTFLGALVSALASRTFRIETIPSVWREQFGSSVTKRMIAAFIGGAALPSTTTLTAPRTCSFGLLGADRHLHSHGRSCHSLSR